MTRPLAVGATWSSTRSDAAVIRPFSGGKAHLSWRGIEHTFDDVDAALAECRLRGIQVEVQPFPNPSVEVVWTSPALAAP